MTISVCIKQVPSANKMRADEQTDGLNEIRSADKMNAGGAFLEAIKGSNSGMDKCDAVVPRGQIAAHNPNGILNPGKVV